MAESADILTSPSQKVLLPDLAAGCSMADMATFDQVEQCWEDLQAAGRRRRDRPVSYMNSSAAIKAFTGEHGGTICTSSNAKRALTWAFEQGLQGPVPARPAPRPQHRRRELGLSLDDCVVYDPRKPGGGLTVEQLQAATMVLWKGHCSVHGRFTAESVRDVRERVPGVTVLVHPECTHEVVESADLVGSTEMIISTLAGAPAGSAWRSAPSSTSSGAWRRSTPTRPSSSSTRPSASARR
jgi:quinolinate synthase